MAWLEGLSTLKGQITNFTKEVLSEGREEVNDTNCELTASKKKVEELEALCASQDLEITELRQRNAELQSRLGTTSIQDVAAPVGVFRNFYESTSVNGTEPHNEELLVMLANTQRELAEKEHLVAVFEEQERSLQADRQNMSARCLQLEEQVKKLSKQLEKESEKQAESELNELEQLRSQLTQANSETLKEQLKAAELRIEELERELQKVHQQMLDHLSDSQMNTTEIRGEVEQTRWQLLQESGAQKTELLRARQDMVNRIIQMGEKSREVEMNMKKLQLDGKHVTADITAIIHKLGDPEQQELIHGALKALELENQVLKLRNAQLELAGNTETIKGNAYESSSKVGGDTENRSVCGSVNLVSKYVDISGSKADDDAESLKSEISELSQLKQKLDVQVSQLQVQVETYERDIECFEMVKSEWSLEKRMLEQHLSELRDQLKDREEKLSLITAHKGLIEVQKQAPSLDGDSVWQKRLQELNAQLYRVQKEKEQLQQGKVCLSSEVEGMAKIVQDLESQLARAQHENTALSSSLEELDTQHQDAIDQLLKVKQSLQKQNEALQAEVSVCRQKFGKEKVDVGTESSCKVTQTEQHDEALHLECRRNIEAELQEKILRLITFDIPEDYYSFNNSDKDDVVPMGTVEALVKMCVECKWKRDTLERKVAELMKELRDTKHAYEERNKTAQELENECRMLKGNVETLIEELMVSKTAGGESLAPIPENSEETEAMEQRILTLENEVEILKEARSNLEADAKRLREEEELLVKRLQTATATLRNQENLETEVRKLQEALTEAVAARSCSETEVKRLQMAADERVKETLAGNRVLENEVKRLEEELKSEISKRETACVQLNEMTAAKNTLHIEVERLRGEVPDKNDLTTERDRLATSVKDLQEKLQQSEESRCGEVALLQEKCRTLEQQVGGLEEQLKTAQRDRGALEETCHSLECANAVIKEDAEKTALHKTELLEQALLKVSEYEGHCRQLQEEQSAHVRNINSLKEELSVKDTQLKKGVDSKSVIETELLLLQDKVKELVELRGEKTLIEGNLRQITAVKLELERKCEELQSEFASKTSEVEALSMAASAEQEEVSKWKEMAMASERQLNEAMKIRSELEQECGRLYRIESRVQNQEHLDREIERLKQLLEEMEQGSSQLLSDKTTSEQQCVDLRTQLQGLQEAEQEARQRAGCAEQQLRDTLQAKTELERRCEMLHSVEEKCKCLEQEISRRQELVVQLREELSEVTSSKSELEAECKRLLSVEGKLRNQDKLEEEIKELKESLSLVERDLHEAVQDKLRLDSALQNEAGREKRDEEALVTELQGLQDEKQKILEVLDEKTRENSALKAENNRLLQVISEQKFEVMKQEEERQFQDNEATLMAKETVANLSKIIKDKDLEIEALVKRSESLVSVLQDSSNKSEVTEKEMLKKELDRLNEERAELIKTVQVKHHESVQYHSEIQRLTGLLSQEMAKCELMHEHEALLLAARQMLEHGSVAAGRDSKVSIVGVESDSVGIQRTVELEVQELTEKEIEVQALRAQVLALQNQLQAASNPVPLQNSNKEVVDEVLLPEDVRVQVEALQSECARIADTLLQEQTRNKYLQNEVQEQYEKEGALLKELERLRLHLVAVEDGYTQEALRAEGQVKDLQSKLSQAEERIKNSSTAYTSASIRANQHVESLQGQARLIAQQRDDIQQKLSAAEDQVQHHSAALRNLQIVLEQFQRDKEREISAATERLQHQLQLEKRRQEELVTEISTLKVQLTEAKEGLSAAARLGEQLDKKTEIITSLKEEVAKLSDQLQETESRVQSASLNMESKVDRYLVKNLVLGYFMAPQNTRNQVLRIVATVLDFNQEERDRVGLDSGSSSSSGWFKSLMHPGKGPPSTQSLSEAFVRFLENESRPQPQLRLLPEVPEVQGESRSDSPNSSASGSQRRSPLLLSEVHLPTFTQFPVGRNSSSILKDVLKDS